MYPKSSGSGDRQGVLVFLRAPQLGKVKTRLSRKLGDSVALILYKAFVSDTLDIVRRRKLSARLYYFPSKAGPVVSWWLGDEFEIRPQKGNDLGERMYNAFVDAFKAGFEKAVLIGTDFPDLPGKIISDGLALLSTKDAVIGPCRDGGYYLLGFRRQHLTRGVFEDMLWGERDVFAKTIRHFENESLVFRVLPTWSDIDDMDDLEQLRNRLLSGRSFAKHTLACMEKLKLI